MLLHLLVDVALGAAFGLLGGLFGIGGGIVAIPILGLAFGMSQQSAQGTALVMVVPNVAIGLWRYYQKRSLNLRYAVTLALSAIPFTYGAARVATGLPSHRNGCTLCVAGRAIDTTRFCRRWLA